MNRVFSYFNVECGQVKHDLVKKLFGSSSLEENKYVADLMHEQKLLKEEIETLIALLSL